MRNKKTAFWRILPLFLAMALCITTQDVSVFAAELSLEEYVVAALENHERVIDVSAYNIPKTKADRAYFGILTDNPQLFYVEGRYVPIYRGDQVKYYCPYYLAGKKEVMQMRKELETAVQKVLEQVDESMDTVQKALVVHDYLVQNCEYDEEGLWNSDSAYGALVDRTARSNGYANAYTYIMDYKLGIPCTRVESERMEHVWNMIEIDGKWYHVDLTWDDPAWDCIGRVNHNYFLLSDKAISQDSPNAPTGNKNHYAWFAWTPNYTAETADSERYDREFWTDVESAISYYNGAWYYSEYEPAGNKAVLRKKTDLFGSNAETVYETSPWQALGQSSDPMSFMYLAQADGKLYFNTSTEIMQMDADGDVQLFYEPEDLAGKQIFGFTVQDGKFLYAPDDVYDTSKKQSDIRRYSPGGEAPPSEDPGETPSPSEDPDAGWWEFKEENDQALQKVKDSAVAELNDNYTIRVGTYHYTDFNDELKRLIDNGIDEINRIVLGYNYDPVGGTYEIAKGTLAGFVQMVETHLTRIKAKLDEQMNLFDWSDLVDVWKAAKEELDNYKKPKDYRPAQQKELENAIEAGKAAIDKAKQAAYVDGNPTSHDPVSAKKEVEKALKAAKAEIDKIKTDAQLKADKTDTTNVSTAPNAGTSFKQGQHTYKVLKKGSEVAFTKTKSTAKSISVPATITYGGIKYKVTAVSGNAFNNNKKVTKVKLGSNITAIGVSAFQGCKKLKTITISSKQLKTVGKKAFKGTYAKAKVKVPSSKKKAYKKLLKGKGLSKKAKIV